MLLQAPVPLVVQWHHRLVAATEGGDMNKAALGLGNGHHWAIAIDSVSIRCEIPPSAFSLGFLLDRRRREFRGWLQRGNLERQEQG